jgi:hypothetical protein
MNIFWEHAVESTCTLFKHDERRMFPQRLAAVTRSFKYGDNSAPFSARWRARIISTGEEKTFSTEDQAKDWAQAVVLLNQ